MKRIALVEDNPDNRLLVTALLEDSYTIEEYEDGKSAIEGIAETPPDLILMDISLPEMDGTEVLAQLRTDDVLKNIPAIALTAHAMSGDREKYLSMGFDEYLTKPIVDEELLFEAVESLL